MHFQNSVQGWKDALLLEPDDVLVKSVDNPGLLREAKLTWAGAGRDPKRLRTLYRHHNVETAEGDWQMALAHWRRMFARWVDKTYLENYAPYVDLVSEQNEYTATSTWETVAEKNKALQNMRAAVQIWTNEYRGKVVRSADGGEGRIPDDCRLAFMAGPVGNDIPREAYLLARDTDSVLDYHAYTHCENGVRSAFDWPDHSGRAFRHEAEHGVKCLHLAGEAGPYLGVQEGWRHPRCLGGNLARYITAEAQVLNDVARTPAYQEGRFLGRARFTSGGGQLWQWYEHDAMALSALARLDARLWKPGDGMDKLSPEKQAEVKVHLDAIWAIVTGQSDWWTTKPVPFKIAPPNKDIEFFKADGSRFVPPQVRKVTYVMDCTEVRGNLLRVWDRTDTEPDWYCDAREVQPLV